MPLLYTLYGSRDSFPCERGGGFENLNRGGGLAFICFKPRVSILYMNKVIAKTVSANQNSVFWLYGLLNQILFLVKILGFISFHML